MKLRSLLLIIGLFLFIFSATTYAEKEEDEDKWILKIGGSYFKVLYQSEVNLINEEIKTIIEMYEVMAKIENNGITDQVKQDLKSISKNTFLTLEKVLIYMRATIPLDGDLSSLLDSKYLRYNKPFNRSDICTVITNIYQLKSEAGILSDSKSKFLSKNSVTCNKFDIQINELTFEYMKEWIKKIPTSKRLADRKNELNTVLNQVYLYIATVYAEGLTTATKSQIKQLEYERKILFDKIINDKFIKLDKAENNLDRYR